MKRGLKLVQANGRDLELAGFKNFPDEEGTETSLPLRPRLALHSVKNFPDEEGTETANIGTAAYQSISFKNFPDEEGTETKTDLLFSQRDADASKTSPMKRGLKQNS